MVEYPKVGMKVYKKGNENLTYIIAGLVGKSFTVKTPEGHTWVSSVYDPENWYEIKDKPIQNFQVGMKVYEKDFEDNIFTIDGLTGNSFTVTQDSDGNHFPLPVYNTQNWHVKEPEMLEPQVGMKLWQDGFEGNIWEIIEVKSIDHVKVKCIVSSDGTTMTGGSMHIMYPSNWHLVNSQDLPSVKPTNLYQTPLTNPKSGMKIYHKDNPTKVWTIDYVGSTGLYTNHINGSNITIFNHQYDQYYEVSDTPPVQIEQVLVDGKAQLKGQKACKGKVEGKICILKDESELGKFIKGSILVTMRTTPAFTHIFTQAAGIVTQTGGVLSHAAIVSREYKIPCIVGVSNLLGQVKDGSLATLDADNGFLYVEPLEQIKQVQDELPTYVVEDTEYDGDICEYCDGHHHVGDCLECFWCDTCNEWKELAHSHWCTFCENSDHDTDDCEESQWCHNCEERVANDHVCPGKEDVPQVEIDLNLQIELPL